ncbi:MAG: zinc metalloprotease HtpX [bacterium]
MNQVKTAFFMTVLTILLVLVGSALGGRNGAIFAFIFALVMNFGSYWFSDKIVLSMYRAQEVSYEEAPELFTIVERLAHRGHLPMPKVYIIPQESPNAFATGRSPAHAAVAATRGILNILSEQELEAVLGHELTHVKNRDTLISTIAATIAGAITMLATMAKWGLMFGGLSGRRRDDNGALGLIGILIVSILAPFAALLVQMAISRSREYMADKGGAELSNHPLALASALEKLQAYSRRMPMQSTNHATAHLFIVNPFKSDFIGNLFSTHPSTEKRVAKLHEYAEQLEEPHNLFL